MEEEFTTETFEDDNDALTLSDLNTGYIGNPAVESSVEFTVKKIVKLTGMSLIGKKSDGTTFKKNLSNVEHGYEVVTDNGAKYTVAGWEVFGKLKSIFAKLQQIEGVKIKLTHLLDGMKSENKKLDKYKVEAFVDGAYKVLDRETKEWFN